MSGLSYDHVKMSVDYIEDADGIHCGRLGGNSWKDSTAVGGTVDVDG